MGKQTGGLIYRIGTEIWIGWQDEFEKDSLNGKASEILNPTNNLLKCEDGSEITLIDYINNLADCGDLNGEMVPCSLGTFLEEATKREDSKRLWHVLFSHIGESEE